MPSGIFLKIVGGWLDFIICTNEGIFPGLVYGHYLPLFKSSVTSRKFMTVILAWIVIFKSLSPKVLHRSFFIRSISCGAC